MPSFVKKLTTFVVIYCTSLHRASTSRQTVYKVLYIGTLEASNKQQMSGKNILIVKVYKLWPHPFFSLYLPHLSVCLPPPKNHASRWTGDLGSKSVSLILAKKNTVKFSEGLAGFLGLDLFLFFWFCLGKPD